jgi:hypothetical protein
MGQNSTVNSTTQQAIQPPHMISPILYVDYAAHGDDLGRRGFDTVPNLLCIYRNILRRLISPMSNLVSGASGISEGLGLREFSIDKGARLKEKGNIMEEDLEITGDTPAFFKTQIIVLTSTVFPCHESHVMSRESSSSSASVWLSHSTALEGQGYFSFASSIT